MPIEVGRNTWRIRKSFFTKHQPLSNPRSQYHTFCKTKALMIWCHTRQYSPADVLHSSHYLFCLTRVDIARRNYLLITPGGGEGWERAQKVGSYHSFYVTKRSSQKKRRGNVAWNSEKWLQRRLKRKSIWRERLL